MAKQQKDREHIHGDFLTGSLVSDYWQINEKVVVTMTVGVKKRSVGSAFYVVGLGEVGSDYGFVTAGVGAGYLTGYLFGPGIGKGDWGFVGSGTG